MGDNEGYVGLLSFCSFAFSVIAAVLAIDLYALMRTGRSGSAWRVLVIASVIFALMHVLRFAEVLRFGSFPIANLSEIVELMFVMSLAYAFYLQRKAFGVGARTSEPRQSHGALQEKDEQKPEPGDEPDNATGHSPEHERPVSAELFEAEEDPASEWARLNGQADAAPLQRGRD